MKLVDANVLIYSVNNASPQHSMAKAWLDSALSQTDIVYLPWLCLLSFVRICTHRGLFPNPMSVEEAMNRVDAWIAAPPARTDLPSVSVAPVLRRMLSEAGSGGNLVNPGSTDFPLLRVPSGAR